MQLYITDTDGNLINCHQLTCSPILAEETWLQCERNYEKLWATTTRDSIATDIFDFGVNYGNKVRKWAAEWRKYRNTGVTN